MFTFTINPEFYHESSEFYSFYRPYYCGGHSKDGVRIELYYYM